MTVKQLERMMEKERKAKVTLSVEQKKAAFDRGFSMFGVVTCLHYDLEYTKKLFKIDSANRIELEKEWVKGWSKAWHQKTK